MKKYNSIIKGLTRTIKKLENLAETNAGDAITHRSLIADLNNKINALDSEGAMAATTARKLSELVGE